MKCHHRRYRHPNIRQRYEGVQNGKLAVSKRIDEKDGEDSIKTIAAENCGIRENAHDSRLKAHRSRVAGNACRSEIPVRSLRSQLIRTKFDQELGRRDNQSAGHYNENRPPPSFRAYDVFLGQSSNRAQYSSSTLIIAIGRSLE
jgi:hypothetical protein